MACSGNGLSYEERKARFDAKMSFTRPEHREALARMFQYQTAQVERVRLSNRARQLDRSADKVFWAEVLPDAVVDAMDTQLKVAIEDLRKIEESAAAEIADLMRRDSWYKEVAVTAAKGIGMSREKGMFTAVKILDAFGSVSRFSTIGQVMKYAGLAPDANGRAPRPTRGQSLGFSRKAFQALYALVDQWNRHDCHWKSRWLYWKAYYRERFPDFVSEVKDSTEETVRREYYPNERISNMAWRKVMREFVHDLWDLWRKWEVIESIEPHMERSKGRWIVSHDGLQIVACGYSEAAAKKNFRSALWAHVDKFGLEAVASAKGVQ